MAISFPRTLPTVTGVRRVDIRAVNAVAYSRSPFTFSGQAHKYPGQMWQADITLPPMNRSVAETWNAFLMSMNGQAGTFLLGDPRACSLMGTATSCTITGSAGDSTVDATVPSGQTLLAGDYIQLGSGATATLHKVLLDYTGTGSPTDLEIWPSLRVNRSGATAALSNTVGVFRLASNEVGWTSDEIAKYGITFAAMEAI